MASQTADPSARVTLRPFGPGDFDRLLVWAPSEEFLMQWSGPLFRWPLTREQLEAYRRTAEAVPQVRRI